MGGGGVGPLSGLLRPRKCRRGGVRCARGHGKRPGPLLAVFSPRVLGFRVSLCPKTQRKQPGAAKKKRTGDGNLGYFENIRIFGFFPAARTTPPALSGSGALVGASPVFLAEDIHDFTSKNMKFMEKSTGIDRE